MDKIVKLLVAGAVLFLLLRAWQNQRGGVVPYNTYETFEDSDAAEEYEDVEEYEDAEHTEEYEDAAEAEAEEGFEEYADWSAEAEPATLQGSQMAPPSVSAALLPKGDDGAGGSWAEFAPAQLQGQNFLDASKYIGVNTTGNSLRNASHDLRSNISIPRQNIGPWQQSTIDADLMRKSLE